jgi:large subunit ribosomal protein L24
MNNKLKIKKGDTVKIMTGRREDKGKTGEVIRVIPDTRRIVVQGVNIATKHQSQVQSQGRNINPGIVKFEAPMDISNVMLVCPKCKKPTRVGVVRTEDGEAKRQCKKCDALFD